LENTPHTAHASRRPSSSERTCTLDFREMRALAERLEKLATTEILADRTKAAVDIRQAARAIKYLLDIIRR
jgi:hypothetical protein